MGERDRERQRENSKTNLKLKPTMHLVENWANASVTGIGSF